MTFVCHYITLVTLLHELGFSFKYICNVYIVEQF